MIIPFQLSMCTYRIYSFYACVSEDFRCSHQDISLNFPSAHRVWTVIYVYLCAGLKRCSRPKTKVPALPAFHLPLHSKWLRCASEQLTLQQTWATKTPSTLAQLSLYLCTTLFQFSGTKCTLEEVDENNSSLELNTKKGMGVGGELGMRQFYIELIWLISRCRIQCAAMTSK